MTGEAVNFTVCDYLQNSKTISWDFIFTTGH